MNQIQRVGEDANTPKPGNNGVLRQVACPIEFHTKIPKNKKGHAAQEQSRDRKNSIWTALRPGPRAWPYILRSTSGAILSIRSTLQPQPFPNTTGTRERLRVGRQTRPNTSCEQTIRLLPLQVLIQWPCLPRRSSAFAKSSARNTLCKSILHERATTGKSTIFTRE